MFNLESKCYATMKKWTVILMICLRKKWLFLLSLAIVSIVGSCVLFPARNRLTSLEIKQSLSNRKLSAFSKWVLANHKNSEYTVTESIMLSRDDIEILRNATLKSSICANDDLLDCEIRFDMFSDYVVHSNRQICVSVFENDNNLIAYEKPGLWHDDTIAVFFNKLGVIRMQQSTFEEILEQGIKGKLKLKFNKHSHHWDFSD